MDAETPKPAEPVIPKPAIALLTVIEKWCPIAAVFSGGTIVLSVVYDWAYFAVVDPSAIQLMSISDHVSSAMQWLPLSVIVYFASLFLNGLPPFSVNLLDSA